MPLARNESLPYSMLAMSEGKMKPRSGKTRVVDCTVDCGLLSCFPMGLFEMKSRPPPGNSVKPEART